MKRTAADVLIETLCDWGVEVVFGLPGDGINGIMEALRTRQDKVRFIQVRHEESAALMACAYAKFTGRLGVCLATSGPGGLHLLNGLYDAKLDQQPVLAITGHHYHDLIGTYAQQDVDLDVVFRDVAVYTARIMGASHVESVAALACRTALAYRGVSHINFPVDLQEATGGARSERNVLGHTSAGASRWRALMEEWGTRQDKPLKPEVVAGELGKRLTDTAIVVADSGTITTWFARHIPVRRGQLHSLSGNLATMACGVPYAIAAQLAHPDRQCVAFVGDGGFSMLMAEFATAVKYRLPIKVVVVKNDTLGQIKWEQMVFLGNPEYGCDLQPIDFVAVARACGGIGLRIEDPADCGALLDEALGTAGPALVEAVVDPFTPPMPPKVTARQALRFAESLAKGEPNRGKIALTVVRDKVRELI